MNSLCIRLIILLMIGRVTSVSLNQPHFCPTAVWNPNATTFANNSTVGFQPLTIFVNTNNSVYAVNTQNSLVQIWSPNNTTPTATIIRNNSNPYSLFVTDKNDIFIDNNNNSVDHWIFNTGNVSTLYIGGKCCGLFIDANNSLYCSLCSFNNIMKRSLDSSDNQITIIAGTGCPGVTPNMLYYPHGIFVDIDFQLYVADSANNRIQMFRSGQLNGTTVAGLGAPETITLNYPTDVVLDADSYLFIVDRSNQRIVGSGPNGFRCIVGCSGVSGSASDQLWYPQTMAFDSYGNIFVVDTLNSRVQRFILATNSCGATTISQKMSTTANTLQTITYTPQSTVAGQKTVSYNRPKFAALASWNPDAITFANQSLKGLNPQSLFVNSNNTVYVVEWIQNQIQVWLEGSTSATRNISGNLQFPYSFFVTSSGDIYVNNGIYYPEVDKWSLNAIDGTTAMYVSSPCFGLFVDMNDILYCSVRELHQVVVKSLQDVSNTLRIVAGTGCPGVTPNMLYFPQGIFVDIDFQLYVADSANNRIQMFRSGQLNGTTVAGLGASGTITLNYPTGVVLDAASYLFIVDTDNERIVGSGPNGFRCIVGCSGVSGSASDQLSYPQTMSFDSYGNIFVVDTSNSRVQKFILATNFSVLAYNQPTLCASAVWSTIAITFANSTFVGSIPYGIFISSNNTIYIPAQSLNLIQVWYEQSIIPAISLLGNFAGSYGLFGAINGDIYIDNADQGRIYQWTSNGTNNILSINVNESCLSLFVDINNALYCSMTMLHQVLKILVNITSTTPVVIAGNGSAGSSANTLDYPQGIFVNTNLDLYVADCRNNRVQLFKYGRMNGTTVVGNGASGSTTIICPTGVTLDANGYLYIVDNNNHRIVRSGPNNSQCVAGCSSVGGSAANQLSYPQSLAFDSYGNLFVVDKDNNRIQKFLLETNLCGTTVNTVQTTAGSTSTQQPGAQSTIITSTGYMTSTASGLPTSVTTTSNQSCFSPTITLIPSTSSLAFPLQFRRSQDFYISSYIQLNCNTSFFTIVKWTISNCSATCSSQLQLGQTVITTSSELFIPARTLAYGTYQLKLIVAMVLDLNLSSSISAYVRITPSGITANLVQFGTSMITRGNQQDLLLDPGTFSVDPDATTFNASNWMYQYYCRIYGHYNFPNIQGVQLTIDDPRIDPLNPSCISNQSGNGTALEFGGTTVSPKSSLTILANSLKSNQTYQFVVHMENRRNASVQATGYLLVQVVDTQPQLILIACVISTLCSPNLEYQFVNPTTQVALFSLCEGVCISINNITWNVYYGVMNVSSNTVQWARFNQMNQYDNIWFFGSSTTDFTATNGLFLSNPSIDYWRFEVVYSFPSAISSSALNFIINQPPKNGSCSISPFNGTTSTLFTISCPNWSDQDGIKDYSFYSWTTDPTEQTILAFSSLSTVRLRLIAGSDNTSVLHVLAYIRDTMDCVSVFNLSTVTVVPDTAEITNLVNSLQTSNVDIANNPLIQILASGNQNTVGQLISSVSQVFNKINSVSVNNAVANGIQATSIAISALDSLTQQGPSTSFNASALIEYNKQLNTYGNVREKLIAFTTNLLVSTSNSIELQASALARLTGATNQLTRTTATLASNKCYQLAFALYSMASEIPYEDAQTAATQISQCASNVLNAVNGPLQQRTSTLDSDSSQANTFPQDYDTDLESDWSNLNLFADGDDFSSETIETNRNLYYQRQVANQIATQTAETMSLLTSALNIHLNIGQKLQMNTSSVFVSLETTSIESLSNKSIAQIEIPSTFQLNSSNHTSISLRSMMQPLASAGNSRLQSNTNLSRSISLTLLDNNGNEIPLQTNVDDPIELIVPRDPNLVIPSMALENVTSFNSTPHSLIFNLHYNNITSDLPISIHFELHPLNISLGYLFIYKFDTSPILNSSVNQIDGWTLFCPSNMTNESLYTYFVDNRKTVGHQSIIFGLRELNSIELIAVCSNSTINSPPLTNQRFNFTLNYELRVYTSGCYYLDVNNNWQSDGLWVGPRTDHYQTQCFSTHLTTFAGGFIVLPAPINWNYVFANADFARNKTVYITLICVCALYILLTIYARCKDRKDLEKLGVTPLPDNDRSDRYLYQILVFTGHRKDAGTQSKVHFVLSGDNEDTKIRTFADPRRKILQRGGIDAFVMAVPESLGLLNYIHIWHDNTGLNTSASWFLKYIIIRDLQTMEKSYFICQKWFAVEKGDGLIERLLPVAGEYQKREFSYVLSKQAYHSLSEGHLWFSIFSRPPSNRFTSVQRCTCCFVLLLTSMLLNILYYDQAAEVKSNTNKGDLVFGPLYITPEQIGIGVIVEILSFVPSLSLVQFFRRIRSRRASHHPSPLRQAIDQIKHQPTPHFSPSEKIVQSPETKSSQLTFPWWCLFLAYGLSLIIAGVSMFFIIARGIEFGDLKTQKWLTSLLSGFFSSILLIQPVKVVGLVIIFGLFIRNTTNDKEAAEFITEEETVLNEDEDYLHSIKDRSPFTHRSQTRVDRLDKVEVAWARSERLKDIQMWSFIREIFTYFTFLAVLYVITYSSMNSNAFYQVQHLPNFFLNTRETNQDYSKITTVDQYWNWLENSFVSNIRAQQWYNHDPPQYLSGFINDKSNRLIGWATMRQLRIRTDTCQLQKSMEHLFIHCNDDYNFSNEEKQAFQPGWTSNQTNLVYYPSISQAFVYRTSDELDTYIYSGNHAIYGSGGYVYEYRGRLSDLQSNLSVLQQLGWLDSQTRAVIIQLTLYNPNSQLFSSITLLSEFLSTGGLETESQFDPISFQVFTSLSELICTVFYMLFIIHLMFTSVESLLKDKIAFCRNIWSWIDLGIICCSWTNVGIYIWRYQEATRIGNLFAASNGFAYINLQLAVYVNQLFVYLLAFCCFFGTIKFVHLCRFNARLILFVRALQHAGEPLLSFACMFSLVFTAFVVLFYLLFVSHMESCASLLETAQTLFQMTLMNFDASELSEAGAFLGPFCLTIFILIVVFVCMSMFFTIINDSFRFVRDHLKEKRNEEGQHILKFAIYKFQRWMGIAGIHERERDEQMRSKYCHPIEHFPDKVDQLLDALNRLYMDQQCELKRFR